MCMAVINQYCMATVNVTFGMTPNMLEEVDEEADKHNMSRAEYMRHCIRQANDSPFEQPEQTLAEVADETGAA